MFASGPERQHANLKVDYSTISEQENEESVAVDGDASRMYPTPADTVGRPSQRLEYNVSYNESAIHENKQVSPDDSQEHMVGDEMENFMNYNQPYQDQVQSN